MENKNENTQKRRKTNIGEKILLRIVTIICVTIIVCFAGYIVLRRFGKIEKSAGYVNVEKQLSLCQELVTAKYRYSDIVTLKKSYAFSKSYSIVKYTGIVRGGISDLMFCKINISPDGKKVYITLPPVEILGNEIVSMEVFDEQRSIFVPITTQEIFDEIQKAKDETLEEIIAEGFLKEAKNYAIRIITQMMLASGFETVEVN